MFFRKGRPVTRLRQATIGHPYGGEPVEAGWDDPKHPPARLEIPNAAIGFGSSTTAYWVDHSQSDLDATLFYEHPADIKPGDRILDSLDGAHYTVAGFPKRWVNPFTGREAGSSVGLRRLET